jgi:hypothetical protein
MTDKADEVKTIILNNPFMTLDFISPVYEKVFSKERLKEVNKKTNEFTDGVFVFDVKELRIMYFHECMTLMKKGRREEMTPTLLIVFTDGSELLSRKSIKEFTTDILPQYLLKINNLFPSEQS